MVVLVRCSNGSCTVALLSRLESLANEGLITAYLGTDGWMEVKSRGESVEKQQAAWMGRRYKLHEESLRMPPLL